MFARSFAFGDVGTYLERSNVHAGVEVLDVEDTANAANVGNGDDEDPDGRTIDGGHPRAAVLFVWVQLFLNKAARGLGRGACLGPPAPTAAPTPRPTREAGGACGNGRLDAGETDVDCGGPLCAPCGLGDACGAAADCASGHCEAGGCAAAPTPLPVARPTRASLR